MSDYIKKSFQLENLIPTNLRNPLNKSLMTNLFDKFFTKKETVPLYGWVGKVMKGDSTNIPYITQSNTERSVNSLLPLICAKIGSDDVAFSFQDILNKAEAIGIDIDRFNEWGASRSYNFAPPIDIDKFLNYTQYFWVGKLVNPTLSWNPNNDAEYYVINNDYNFGIGNDWQRSNYWVHKLDMASLGFSQGAAIQATRPIIEYFDTIELNAEALSNGKYSFNQLPLFNLYGIDYIGDTIGISQEYVSSIFYYVEGQEYSIDSVIKRRIKRDANADMVFGHGLHIGKKLLYFKDGAEFKTIWRSGPDIPVLTKTNPISASGLGDGSLTVSSVSDFAISETWTITAISPTVFKIFGSKTGQLTPNLVVGTPTTYPTFTLNIANGSTDFSTGDVFTFRILNKDIPRYVYKNSDGFVINFPGGASADTSSPKQGAWITPFQLLHNPYNDIRTEIRHGDLIDHFRTILGLQVNFEGSPSGTNNSRTLTIDPGLGGKIKIFDDYFNLFISMMCQRDITPISILDWAENSYLQSLNSIADFIDQHLITYLTSDQNPTPSTRYDTSATSKIIDLYNFYVEVYSQRSDLQPIFYDTTSNIKNWGPTLPQLGLAQAVQPSIGTDYELGISVITHHDGHKSPILQTNPVFERQLAQAEVIRSDGTKTSGFVQATMPPLDSNLYKNSLWYDTSSSTLKLFNVLSDTSVVSTTPQIGDFLYIRLSHSLKRWDGIDWVAHSDPSDVWTVVDTAHIKNTLILYVEQQLFNSSITTQKWTNTTHDYMEYELVKFAAKYEYDPYGSDYKSSDPFTWNYASFGSAARWFDVYTNYFDSNAISLPTSRPDIEPWKLVGLLDKPTDWDDGSIAGSVVPFKNTYSSYVDVSMEKTNVRAAFISNLTQFLISIGSIDLLNCPTTLDGVSLALGDRVLVSDDGLNSKYNGIYYVFSITGSTCRLLRTADAHVLPIGTNVSVSEGDKWGGSAWVITNTGALDVQPIIWRQYNRSWTMEMWDFIQSFNPSLKLCVNIFNDNILPPYVSSTIPVSVFALYNTIPASATDTYAFGENGPIETVWKKSLEYRYSELRSDFKSWPIRFLTDTWGFHYVRDLNIDSTEGFKLSHKDFYYHGDLKSDGSIYKYYGLCQYYTEVLRYNSVGTTDTYNSIFYNNWEVKLGHRINSLVRSEDLSLRTDQFTLPSTSYKIILKKNPYVIDSWLDSLRIQLVKIGTAKRNKYNVLIPDGMAEDWQFRIESYNRLRPQLSYYILDSNQNFETFSSLGKANCPYDWNIYQKKISKGHLGVPMTVTGLQNVLNILYGYTMRLQEDGWDFSGGDSPHIDRETGRLLDWQLEIEKFINFIYSGMEVGGGVILNPFISQAWINTPRGMVSTFNATKFFDINLAPAVYDILGKMIQNESLTIIRTDEKTSIKSATPISFIHSYIDEYEHVIIFNEYVNEGDNTNLLFDPFIGASVSRIMIIGERPIISLGRPNFGGYVLSGNTVTKNIEGHVNSMQNFYNPQSIIEDDAFKHAMALLGYSKKEYFDLLDISDNSQFQFWRGLIQYKGTNSSMDAYLNSAKFKDARIDEYWAYKIATYGDARPKMFPELKLTTYDCIVNHSKFQFESLAPSQNNLSGFSFIEGLDEARWYSIDDLGNYVYFQAEEVGRIVIEPTSDPLIRIDFDAEALYEVPTILTSPSLSNGSIEIIPVKIGSVVSLPQFWTCSVNSLDTNLFDVQVLNGSIPVPFNDGSLVKTVPINQYITFEEFPYLIFKFVPKHGFEFGDIFEFEIVTSLVNHNLIASYDASNHSHTIIGFNPVHPKFDPLKLIDYVHNTYLTDIPVWHPAIGWHNTDGLENVTITSDIDPAKYSSTVQTVGNNNYDPLRPWQKKEVGRIWWDTSNVSYIPYFDENIFPNREERLSRWGNMTDYSSINVYEWIESSVPPSEYNALSLVQDGNTEIDPIIRASGQAARKQLYKRNRQIYARPIAWGERDIIGVSDFISHSFASQLFLSQPNIGSAFATLDTGKFEDFGITSGMKLTAWDVENNKPIGEATFGESMIDYIIGSQDDYTAPLFDSSDIANNFNITLLTDPSVQIVGSILFSPEEIDGVFHIRASQVGVDVSDVVSVLSFNWETIKIGDTVTFSFPNVGIELSGVMLVEYDHVPTSLEQFDIASAFGSESHDVFLRNSVKIDITLPFPDVLFGNDFENEDVVTYYTYGWKTWKEPTASDLSSDLLSPNNKWEPFYGDYVQLDLSFPLITQIQDFDNTGLVMKSGEVVKKYKYIWTDWKLLTDTVFDYIVMSPLPVSLDVGEIIDLNRLSVYINGLSVLSSMFSVIGSTVQVNELTVGSHIHVIYRKYSPTTSELSFDPEVSDDITIQTQYKNDYSYSTVSVRDSSGNISSNKYYYWVENKSTVALSKTMSIQQITKNIKNGPDLFMNFQNNIPASLLSSGEILPIRYDSMVVHRLNRYVTRDNTYKLRLSYNFTLQDDPHNLDLKNTHTEWTLIRRHQQDKIPEQLWNKLTDAVCGLDIAGNIVPSDRRSDFDRRHGTRTRFGFKPDQILVDTNFAKSTIIYTIRNTQLTKEITPNVFMPDFIEGLDLATLETRFITEPRIIMDYIWNVATNLQVNEIFFNVLEDALSQNYEFTDIMKTSLISAYSVRFIPQQIASEYDDF